MTQEEKAIRTAFKPYIEKLKDTPVLALIGKEQLQSSVNFWASTGQTGKIKDVKVSWMAFDKCYVWSCTVEKIGDWWQRVEEQTSSEVTADSFWRLIRKEAKHADGKNCVVMMASPALNEMGRKICKWCGVKCLTWNSKIGIIADGFEKETAIGA